MPNISDYIADPLPEREQNVLLDTVKDIMHNGGKIPVEVSNQLIMAAIIELNKAVARNANLSRRNALRIQWVGIVVGIMLVVVAGFHVDEIGIIKSLFAYLGG